MTSYQQITNPFTSRKNSRIFSKFLNWFMNIPTHNKGINKLNNILLNNYTNSFIRTLNTDLFLQKRINLISNTYRGKTRKLWKTKHTNTATSLDLNNSYRNFFIILFLWISIIIYSLFNCLGCKSRIYVYPKNNCRKSLSFTRKYLTLSYSTRTTTWIYQFLV